MNRLLETLRDGSWLTPRRMRNYACISAAVLLGVIVLDVRIHTRCGVVDDEGEQLGRDFVNYWSGAKLALQGKAAVAYDVDKYVAYQRDLRPPRRGARSTATRRPPCSLPCRWASCLSSRHWRHGPFSLGPC